MALSGISQERFKRGSPNFTDLVGAFGLANLPDMTTTLAASGWLQNAIKYCTKVCKMDVTSQRIEYFGHCLTFNHQIL